MRRLIVGVLLALVLSGCTRVDPSPTTATPTIVPPTPDPDPTTPVSIVSIDGRWAFDEAGARAIAGGGDGAGAFLLGEARLDGPDTSVAGPIAALDANALALLGGAIDALPKEGEIILSQNASAGLGVAVGDEIAVVSYHWPGATVTPAFEMERVRPCDPVQPAALCIQPTTPNGSARLALRIPERSSDLSFHADVVELRPSDFPAEWNGTITSPGGRVTPFETSARSRTDVSPPSLLAGPTQPGVWTIQFDLKANHTRIPGAVAGLITYRTRGYAAFDVDLLHLAASGDQTRALLANGTRSEAHLRVAGTYAPGGAPSFLHAAALVSPADARALLDIPAGAVTSLVLPTRAGIVSAVKAGAYASQDADLRSLLARPALALDAPARGGLLWAPPDLDAARLVEPGTTITVEGALPPGAPAHLANASLAARLLALPTNAARVPWSLVPRALWANTSAAYAGIATGPHLVMVSDDLARSATLSPGNMTYSKLEMDSSVGARTLFAMGAVQGGPPSTVWVGAPLLASAGRPMGARLVVAGDADALARAWAPLGVARLVDG